MPISHDDVIVGMKAGIERVNHASTKQFSISDLEEFKILLEETFDKHEDPNPLFVHMFCELATIGHLSRLLAGGNDTPIDIAMLKSARYILELILNGFVKK